MENNWNVQNFLEQLRSAQPQQRSNEPKSPQLPKTYVCIPENLGRYQIFPVNSTVTGMPFEYLYKTREVNLPFGKKQDGSDNYSWLKLLPLNAYNFIDSTNRLVTSLTNAELDLLQSAYGVFDKLWGVVPESQRKDICRIKNYSIGNAYVINKFGLKDQTKPEKSRFCTTLVCTSKNFADAINKDIEMQMINYANDTSWLTDIYNRKPEGRTGWLIFNVTPASNGIGFSVSASHTINLPPAATEGLVITEEEMNLMSDPIRNFLGRQAGKDKLFNESLIINMIEQMNSIISKYSNSAVYVNNEMAVNATVQAASMMNPQAVPTNDPMISNVNPNAAPQQGTVLTQEQMASNNQNPFVTPPAAQFDPMAGVPVNMGTAPQMDAPQQQVMNTQYQQPAFAQGAYVQPGFAQPQQPQANIPNPFDSANPNPYQQNQ